ncbi:hypothetical protein LSH36_302g04040, partial [Paralvinella palmiformis]
NIRVFLAVQRYKSRDLFTSRCLFITRISVGNAVWGNMTPLASLLRICNLMTLTLCIYGGEIRIRPGHEHIRNDSHPSSGFSQRRLEDRLPPTTIPINFNILGSGMFKKKMEFGWRPGKLIVFILT